MTKIMSLHDARKHCAKAIEYYKRFGWKLGLKVMSKSMSTIEAPRRGHMKFSIGKTSAPNHGCGPIAVFCMNVANVRYYFRSDLLAEKYIAVLVMYKQSKRRHNFVPGYNGYKLREMYGGTRLADKIHPIAIVGIHA